MNSALDFESRRENPAERANVLSILTFAYVIPLFKKSFRRSLDLTDLYKPLNEHKSSILGHKLEQTWKEQYKKDAKWALHRALSKIYGVQFTILLILKTIDEIMTLVVMPISIGRLLAFFEKDQTHTSINEAYAAAGAMVACLTLKSFINHPTMMALTHMLMKMRIACSSLIYRKTLRLTTASLGSTTVGHLVNLLSNDVRKFDEGVVLLPYIIIAPLEGVIGTYLIYREIGNATWGGIIFLVAFVPLQIYLSKKMTSFRWKTALRTDERVRLMNEIISGIQVIKMYCWEKPFAKLIAFARKKEMQAIRNRAMLLSPILAVTVFVTRTSIFISIMTYFFLQNSIEAKKIFAVIAIYSLVRPIITIIFSVSLFSLAEVHISLKRIQSYLSLEEKQIEENKSMQNGASSPKTIEPKIILKDVTAKWTNESLEPTLENINISVDSNKLVAVVGPVGSGKTSLFSVLLKELPIQSGELEIEGRISYASQEPWLFSGTVRQNILFGSEFDPQRYDKVIKVCALQTDLQLLPYGDKTLVGEKGKSLSGGQKARINLARCIYKDTDIYLLDDPLSAVDAKVGKFLYDNCIRKFLHNKICVLITHQLQYIKSADKIIIIDDGLIKFQGPYYELRNSELDFAELMKENNEQDKDNISTSTSRSRLESESFDDEENLEDFLEPDTEKEYMAKGSVKFNTYWRYLRAGGSTIKIMFLLFLFLLSQSITNLNDWYVAYWVNKEEDSAEHNVTLEREPIMFTYTAITIATIILPTFRTFYYFFFFIVASINLHDTTFRSIIQASMRFFNHNPSGRILNRFSKDLGIVDEYIVGILMDVLELGLQFLGALVLSVIVNVWLSVPSVVLILVFYFVRKLYIRTSRSVKRIEAVTRSPVFSHATTSWSGLTTIRAFSAEKTLIQEFDEHQDNHSCAYYLFVASSRCFGFWLDMFCALFTATSIFVLAYFNKDINAGDMGIVVTQHLGLFNAIQWAIRQFCELENQMISVERILEYQKIEQEPIRKKLDKLPKDWPEHGRIEFKNVFLKYNPQDPYVLKDLNFVIEPREKIGIVGRTGAGKSSLLSVLFQLYEIEGSIIVDDVDTTELPLEDVRNKISIIPQEPVLFSGTMRKNLDPFEEYSDEVIWNALAEVELKDVVSELPAGLNSTVSEGGTNFSVGQRQLICLARALIRNNKILVLDEATANVDPHTDILIQNTIRMKFKNCTVLTIAHRLHTVMDSDRILVMAAGKAVEFDHPHILLENEDSVLNHLVNTAGKSESVNLKNIARENYDRR